jgi:hypothetical protein
VERSGTLCWMRLVCSHGRERNERMGKKLTITMNDSLARKAESPGNTTVLTTWCPKLGYRELSSYKVQPLISGSRKKEENKKRM